MGQSSVRIRERFNPRKHFLQPLNEGLGGRSAISEHQLISGKENLSYKYVVTRRAFIVAAIIIRVEYDFSFQEPLVTTSALPHARPIEKDSQAVKTNKVAEIVVAANDVREFKMGLNVRQVLPQRSRDSFLPFFFLVREGPQ